MKRKTFENYKTDYTLEKDWIFPFSEINAGAKILLYGAGDVGQAYYEQIYITKYCQVVCWADKEYQEYRAWGIPVDPIEDAKGKTIDYAVIAVASHELAREINDYLLKFGISQETIIWVGNIRRTIRNTPIETFVINPAIDRVKAVFYRRGICEDSSAAKLLLSKILDWASAEDHFVVPRLVLQLTNVCTMRCKNCNNLIPMIKDPCHESFSDVLEDIDDVLANVDMIISLELLGGEPFTYPWLRDVLDRLIPNDKILEIEITTNGTILPKTELLEKLSDGKVHVIISDYGHDIQYEVEKAFLLYGVHYEVRRGMKWIDSGGIVLRNKTEDERKDNYRNCSAGIMCKALHKGKILQCARASSLYELGLLSKGYLDVRSSVLSTQKIRDFWLEQDCVACNYCDYAEPWRVIDAPKEGSRVK